jgi:DNA-binding transcriptional MerR regulator
MAHEPVVIPEKIYFKIGEVCELLDVQAHVLRYWETEFSMLSPQKNKSGQRSYRRRDVEIAVRIKQLLYNEMFTIAGARKKLLQESRDGNKLNATKEPVRNEAAKMRSGRPEAPTLFDVGFHTHATPLEPPLPFESPVSAFDAAQQDAVRVLAENLLELREILKAKA